MPKRRRTTTDEPRELATSGALCLAFANTAAPRRDDRRVVPDTSDPIASYGDLVALSRRLGAIDDGVAERRASSSTAAAPDDACGAT